MENLVNEIENLLWASECTKVSLMLPVLFSHSSNIPKALDYLYSTSKRLLSKNYLKESIFLLNSLKTYSLSSGLTFILTDIKNLLSYCYRLKKKFLEAIQEIKESLNICKSKPELLFRLPVLFLNLSAIYREDLKNNNLAKTFAESAYDVCLKLLKKDPENKNLTKNLAVSILSLGKIEQALKNKESAVM